MIGTSSIFRTKFNEIICFPDWDDENGLHKNEYDTTPILHYLCRNQNYWLFHQNTVDGEKIDEDHANKLWYIIRYYRSRNKQEAGFKLRQGDTIKLGRVRFRVKEINRGVFAPKKPAATKM